VSAAGSAHAPDAASYESFYGLAQAPFALAPDPGFLYHSASHDAAIRQILQALKRREAFIVLSGEIGTGKTTLCRALLQQLDPSTIASLVLNPFLAIEELLRQALVDFGVVSREGASSDRFARATKHELLTTLCDFLTALAPIRGSAVMILDEAQHLSPRVLEELRVISGMGGHDSRLLQVILVGQPNLLDVLAASDLRQLDQRVSLKVLLTPLDRDDVEDYIAHRLTVAGESVSVMFEPAAIKRVHALSGGIPRMINLLCDRALMAGAERGVHEITPDIVERAADALSFRRTPATPPSPRWQLTRRPAIVLVTVAVVMATLAVAPMHRLVASALPELPSPPPSPAAPAAPRLPPQEVLFPRAPAPTAPEETPDDFVAPRR
jgi:general secretion pathway protein A